MDELSAENKLILEAFANAKKNKKDLYLDGLLATRFHVKVHFGIVGDCYVIKELEEHDVGHPDISAGTFAHLQELFATPPKGQHDKD